MKRKVSRWLVLLVLLLVLLVSVGYSQTVRIAGFGGIDKDIVENLIKEYVSPKLPGVKVVYEPVEGDYLKVLLNSLSAGTAADLFYMDIFFAQNVIASGAVEPLDGYIAKSKILKKEMFIDSLNAAFTYQGKLYGIAKDFNTLAIFYNKDIFDEAKVAYPDEKDTWETLEKKLAEVTKKTKVAGIALAPEFARFGAFAYATGWEPIVKGKTMLTDSRFVRAFEWYTGLKKKGIAILPADVGEGWSGGVFAQEKSAACIEGAWILNFLKDKAPNMNYGATFIPLDPQTKKRGNFIFTVAWGINAKSKVKDAAFQVLELLTSPDAQQYVLERGLAIPSRKALVDNPYFKKQTKDAQANKVVFMGASDGYVRPFFFQMGWRLDGSY